MFTYEWYDSVQYDEDDAVSRNVALLHSMIAGMKNIHNPATIKTDRNDCPPSIAQMISIKRGRKHNTKPIQASASRVGSFHWNKIIISH